MQGMVGPRFRGLDRLSVSSERRMAICLAGDAGGTLDEWI